MDVDESKHRPGRGRRGSHALRRRRRKRAGPAGTDRRPVKDNRTKLYIIQEPEAPGESNVFQLNAIRSYFHGLATPRPIGPPWPRQVVWRDVPRGPGPNPV
jgi:hypothetical protein